MGDNENQKKNIQISIIGAYAVGKTCLLNRFFNDHCTNDYAPTVAVGYFSKENYELENGQVVDVIFQDTAGQERYDSLIQPLISRTDGIIIVYSISDEESFQELQKYIKIATSDKNNKPIFILGNKSDLEKERKISKVQLSEFASAYNYPFGEASAKSGENVSALFNQFIEIVYESLFKKEEPKVHTVDISQPTKPLEEKKKCCK